MRGLRAQPSVAGDRGSLRSQRRLNRALDGFNWSGRMYRLKAKGVYEMITDEIKQVVKTRYGKFAETGGKPAPC